MIIYKCDGIIKAFDNPPCFECRKIEVYRLPTLDHFGQIVLDIELLRCLLGNVYARLNVLHEAHAKSSSKSEVLTRTDLHPDLF
jgi:hypothetical protein